MNYDYKQPIGEFKTGDRGVAATGDRGYLERKYEQKDYKKDEFKTLYEQKQDQRQQEYLDQYKPRGGTDYDRGTGRVPDYQ